jgi:hypothetical protein
MLCAGHDSKRAGQLWKAMYGDKLLIRSLDDADASAHRFAAAFKAAVTQAGSLAGGLTLQSVSTARDGTHKLVFAVHGGPGGNVETVLIPMTNRCVLKHQQVLACGNYLWQWSPELVFRSRCLGTIQSVTGLLLWNVLCAESTWWRWWFWFWNMHKLVFAVHGGPGGNVETVLIPMTNRYAAPCGPVAEQCYVCSVYVVGLELLFD